MDSNYASNFNGPFNPTSAEPACCKVAVDKIDTDVEPIENKIKIMQGVVDNICDSLFPIMDILGAHAATGGQIKSPTNMLEDLDSLRERLGLIAVDVAIIKRYIMG